MRKRDIQINYDMLAVLLTQLSNYQKAITNIIDSMDAVHNAVAADNNAESIKKLQKRYKKASKRLKDCRDEVIALHLLLNEYVKDMTAIIVPKSGMTRVSRNDIYWNKKSIQGAMETVKLLRSSIPYMPEDPYAYEEEEKQKMERNYNKIEQNIGANILDKLAGKMEEDIRKLDVYYKKVKDYENKDDEYRLKVFAVRQMYSSPWELFKQNTIDIANTAWKIVKGAGMAVIDLIKGFYSIGNMLYYGISADIAASVALISDLCGQTPPDWTDDVLGESEDYFGNITHVLTHPAETIESMADGLNQTLETEGLEYLFGYAVTDILIGKAAEGKFKGKKVTNKVDDAVEAVEDAGKAADVTKATDLMDDVDDVADLADKADDFYNKVYDDYYDNQFDPLEDGAIAGKDDIADIAEDAGKTDNVPKVDGKAGDSIIPDKAKDIARQIKAKNGVAPPGYKGGRTYRNMPLEDGAQKLPEGVNYKEYDINPYVKGQNRGTERIVIGDDGSVWYTNDHYHTFTRIE